MEKLSAAKELDDFMKRNFGEIGCCTDKELGIKVFTQDSAEKLEGHEGESLYRKCLTEKDCFQEIIYIFFDSEARRKAIESLRAKKDFIFGQASAKNLYLEKFTILARSKSLVENIINDIMVATTAIDSEHIIIKVNENPISIQKYKEEVSYFEVTLSSEDSNSFETYKKILDDAFSGYVFPIQKLPAFTNLFKLEEIMKEKQKLEETMHVIIDYNKRGKVG